MLVENDVRMGVPSWVHKELSKSYREGTAQKLKSMALPYKTKVREKKDQYFDFGVSKFHKDLSKSNREGIDQKLQTMAFPYKIKGWKKICPQFKLSGENMS